MMLMVMIALLQAVLQCNYCTPHQLQTVGQHQVIVKIMLIVITICHHYKQALVHHQVNLYKM